MISKVLRYGLLSLAAALLPAAAQAQSTPALGNGLSPATVDIPYVENDPSIYASPDPLSRTLLSGGRKGAASDPRNAPSRTKSSETPKKVVPDRAPDALRDALNDASSHKTTSRRPASTVTEPADAAKDASARLRKAMEQLNGMLRRVVSACGAADGMTNCADHVWGEQAPRAAAQDSSRDPKRPVTRKD